LEMTERLNEEVEALMEQFGVERIQRSSGSQLYVTGLDQDDARVADAAAFALAAKNTVAEISEEFGQSLEIRAGMSAGDVATGVLGTTQPSFGAWGDPPGTAATLGSLAHPGQLLADGSVVEALGPEWDVGPLEQLPGLADDIDAHVVNGPVGVPAQQA
jgi:class 3 adenylate cyclase